LLQEPDLLELLPVRAQVRAQDRLLNLNHSEGGNMPWESTTLSTFLGPMVNMVNDSIDKMQEEAQKLMKYEAKIEEKLTELKTLLTELEDFAKRLEASGFYIIKLSPGEGSWSDRLLQAENRPPVSPEFYTAVSACLVVAPSPDAVADAYDKIKNALTKKIEMPEVEPEPPSYNPYIFEPEEPPEDEWKSLALKDIFPGMAGSVEKKLNKVKAEVTKVEKVLEQIRKKYNKIMQAIDELQGFLNDLNATGIYRLLLLPNKGSWISRMLSEPGAPPTGGNWYSAGIVIVVCVPTLDECETLFQNLTSLG
jgi:chaperonin cofactor prefoldin